MKRTSRSWGRGSIRSTPQPKSCAWPIPARTYGTRRKFSKPTPFSPAGSSFPTRRMASSRPSTSALNTRFGTTSWCRGTGRASTSISRGGPVPRLVPNLFPSPADSATWPRPWTSTNRRTTAAGGSCSRCVSPASRRRATPPSGGNHSKICNALVNIVFKTSWSRRPSRSAFLPRSPESGRSGSSTRR